MCWVKAEFYRGGGGIEVKLNLGIAIAVEDHGDHFKINYAGEEGYYSVKKTPEMVEAYNSLVPVKSQPVVPAEPEEPFRITGLGLYEMRSGEQQRIDRKDPDDQEPMWIGSRKGWYFTDGRWNVNNPANDIVKLIMLDEVQP